MQSYKGMFGDHVFEGNAEDENNHLVLRGGTNPTVRVPQFVDVLVDELKTVDERIVPLPLLVLCGLLGLLGRKRRGSGLARLLPPLVRWRHTEKMRPP